MSNPTSITELDFKMEAWRRGILSWKLRPVQKRIEHDVDNSPGRKHVSCCSRRIGKSFRLCLKAVSVALQKQDGQIRYISNTGTSLEKVVKPIMKIILKDCPPELMPIWKPQSKTYEFPSTDSIIHLSGANGGHEDDARGTSCDLAIVDEAGFVDRLTYLVESVLMPQLLTCDGELEICGTPPLSPAHDFAMYAQKAEAEGWYSVYDIHQSDYSPELIAEFCEEAGGSESATWLREYMCQFIVDPELSIIPEWEDEYEKYIKPHKDYHDYYYRYVSLDIGFRHLTAALFGYYDFMNATLIIEDEYIINGPSMNTEILAGAIRKKEKELWNSKEPRLRIADNNNLILLQDLSSLHGINFSATNKDNLSAMVNEVRLWVSSGRIKVHPRCKQLAGCLKYGVWTTNRKDFQESSTYGHFDALAALIYMVRNIDQSSNPIPRMLGLSRDDMFIPKEYERLDNNAESISKIFKTKFTSVDRRFENNR